MSLRQFVPTPRFEGYSERFKDFNRMVADMENWAYEYAYKDGLSRITGSQQYQL